MTLLSGEKSADKLAKKIRLIFFYIYGSKILEQLNIEKIEPKFVIMNSTLLHGKI